MKKYFDIFVKCAILATIACSVVAGQENPAAPQNSKGSKTPNEPPNVYRIDLDRATFYTCAVTEKPCPEARTAVIPTAEDKELDTLVFTYKVTAGKMIKVHNSEVIWDLTGVKAGTYSVTVGADDGRGVRGKKLTRTIELRPPPSLVKVSLNKTRVSLWCPFSASLRSKSEGFCPKSSAGVDVSVTALNAEQNVDFYYIVTGGRIIGEGPRVRWDFADTPPGEYKITVGVGHDLIIFGELSSATVKADECPVCDPPCVCNALSTEGPKHTVKRGQIIVFTSKVEGGIDTQQNWTVTDGTILNDPTSSSIMVRVTDDKNVQTVVATIELSGQQPWCSCPVTSSSHAQIEDPERDR